MHPRMNVWFVSEGQSVYTFFSVFFTLVLFMLRCFSFVSDKLNIPNTRQDYGIPLDKYILKLGTHHTVLVRRIKRINYQNISLPRCVVSIQRYPSRNLRWPLSAWVNILRRMIKNIQF